MPLVQVYRHCEADKIIHMYVFPGTVPERFNKHGACRFLDCLVKRTLFHNKLLIDTYFVRFIFCH